MVCCHAGTLNWCCRDSHPWNTVCSVPMVWQAHGDWSHSMPSNHKFDQFAGYFRTNGVKCPTHGVTTSPHGPKPNAASTSAVANEVLPESPDFSSPTRAAPKNGSGCLGLKAFQHLTGNTFSFKEFQYCWGSCSWNPVQWF